MRTESVKHGRSYLFCSLFPCNVLFGICQFWPRANSRHVYCARWPVYRRLARMDENLFLEGRQAAMSKLAVLKKHYAVWLCTNLICSVLFLMSCSVDIFSICLVNNLYHLYNNNTITQIINNRIYTNGKVLKNDIYAIIFIDSCVLTAHLKQIYYILVHNPLTTNIISMPTLPYVL